MTIENPYWPNNLPFAKVYKMFFRAVENGSVTIKGFNIREQKRAFRNWVQTDTVQRMIAKSRNKDQKQLTAESSAARREVSDFSDEEIDDQIATYKRIAGADDEAFKKLLDSMNADGYMRRLIDEKNRRNNID